MVIYKRPYPFHARLRLMKNTQQKTEILHGKSKAKDCDVHDDHICTGYIKEKLEAPLVY